MQILLALLLVLCLPLSAIAQEKPQRPAVPPVNEEVSEVPGVSIIRQPFAFFGTSEGSASGGEGEYRMQSKRTTLKDALQTLCPLPYSRLFFETELPGGSYNISVQAESQEAAFAALSAAYEKAFGLTIVRESRNRPALVLQESDADDAEEIPAVENYPGYPLGSIHELSFRYTGSMEDFAAALDGSLGKPVVCDVKREGGFRFEIETRPGSRRADFDAWLKKHGLKLVQAEREVEGIFVEATPKE